MKGAGRESGCVASFFFQAEDGIRDLTVTGVQTCALPISYAVVVAGLAAIEGTKHGGISARVETMFEELRRARDLKKALGERLRRGEPVVGFGHPLYPTGDPRAKLLMELLGKRFPKSAELAFARGVARAGEEVTGEKPTVDFALAALARTLKLHRGA